MTREASRDATRDAVVVPVDHGGSSLACLRSLGRAGVRTVGVSAGDAPAARSKYCDEVVYAPSPDEDLERYGDALLSLARRPDVCTVASLYEPDVYVLSERREAFAEHVATPWPSFERVRAAQDRFELASVAARAGVGAPDTALLDDWDDWDRRAVVKPRYAVVVEDGRTRYPGVRVTEPGEEPDREAIVEEMGHVPVVQEFVPGDEHGFFALFDDGAPVAAFQHRRERSYTYSGGASVFRTAYRCPDLQAAGVALLRELGWHGPAMVEVRRDARDGEYKLVEVNPRFWGSLPLAVHAGVDFPRLYYELATGRLSGPAPVYDDGVGCHVLRGEASYLHSVLRYEYDHVDRPSLPGAVADVVGSVLRHRNFDYLAADDPMPFLADLRRTAGV